ncbi:YhcN/YlaJ family sporulation lipoprotein [Aquisalibacillus elongatus]|uniref:YhcN/YlaJ family sporulation lipoprotein n=1 Tax=Aquisalibacillus elongatus TaxID=485577 RepID=A0A3N5BF82_9BACI|nr:YhcN/YlaJ family sporulation lipoprotein [Aquisalibacillus elongatus]RPF56127.1 YhcN/YlaJ family sporulation lipoprotein [Aquisalibacillus elongatus]
MKYKGLNIMMLIILFSAGCMSQQQGNNMNSNPDIEQLSDSETEQSNNHSNREASQRLAKLATQVPNVNDARVLVFGSYTLIGIDIDEDLDRSRVGSVKYSVTEAVKDDPFGHYAFVMADGDIMERIRNMNQMIRNGEPADAIIDEISNVVGRYLPETPTKEKTPKQDEPSNTRGDADEDITNIQKEQGNQN